MKIKESIAELIKKNGNTLAVKGTDKSWKAIILPLQYRNKLYVEEVSVPAGMIDRAAYFYVGLPENDLTVYPRGTLFECNGETLTLTHSEINRIADEAQYVWAVFNLYSK